MIHSFEVTTVTPSDSSVLTVETVRRQRWRGDRGAMRREVVFSEGGFFSSPHPFNETNVHSSHSAPGPSKAFRTWVSLTLFHRSARGPFQRWKTIF